MKPVDLNRFGAQEWENEAARQLGLELILQLNDRLCMPLFVWDVGASLIRQALREELEDE
jgi:hypothetical protein